MKINLVIAILIAAFSADAALAQQTGRVPVPPPARPGSTTTAPDGTLPAPPPLPPGPTRATPAPGSSVRPSGVVQPRPPATGRPQQTNLLLEIETPSAQGRIAVAIYRDADSFRRSRNAVRTMMLDRRGAMTPAYVQGLPPGRYAIAVFQDVDGDGQMGKGAFGLPREPFGFSNDARARFGPPGFDAAAFTVTATGATQRIVVRNPRDAILR